ncbi:MAG: hypothetical protein H0T46_27845 [Deltaproteobacteria bacterium]|nr:hypothetical protein [Deltaproteobacteria bacterium]
MESGELVSYALAAIGFMAMAWAGWSSMELGIDREIGNVVLLKLLKANNYNRARKLCSSAPGTYFDAVKAAIEAAANSGTRDLTTLEALAMPAFDAKATAVQDRWRGITERGLIGALLVFGGAALALSGSGVVPVPHLIASGVALLACAWFVLRRNKAKLALDTARREIVPSISKAIIDAASTTANPPKPPDDTNPFRTLGLPKPRPKHALPSLRESECPLCGPTTTRSIDRDGGTFTVLVCTGCGYTQEFADLTRLDAS